jgi:ABC-type Fe3+/spermidine/putrescine transport system ATPase subunit
VGPAKDLYERPAAQFVAEFLGDSTVFPGTVTAVGIKTLFGILRVTDRSIEVGSAAALVVRPEQLGITTDLDAAPLGHNALNATVSEVVYLGPALKFILSFDNGQTGMVRVSSQAVTGIGLGTRVCVHWKPSDGVLVRAST